MKIGLGRDAAGMAANRASSGAACLQCGTPAPSSAISFCRRCGLPYGAPPRVEAELPSCPTCYATVGDDEYLETLRRGDRIVIGRWEAPFDLVRRYLVTGAYDGGRRREYQHSAIVTAMSQLKRWGPGADLFGDQAEWKEAREAVTALMERYHRP